MHSKFIHYLFGFLFLTAILHSCAVSPEYNYDNLPTELDVPSGFKLEVYAEVENARAMCLGDKGTLFVGSRAEGKVYAVIDNNQDYVADEVIEVDKSLWMPVGVAFNDGDLYVSDVNRILRYDDIEENLNNLPEPVVVSNDFPDEASHGWKFIDFGPDGKLYVPVGAPCNICEEDPEQYAVIQRMDKDGGNLETYSKGVRNTVGFDWHPITGELWFTDNGRDWMGNDLPPCELNKASNKDEHFGYPYCHGKTVLDPEFGDGKSCDDYVKPQVEFEAHSAPLGMCFYTGDMFPSSYKNQILVARHGSWNRDTKIGYDVCLVTLRGNHTAEKFEPIVTGFEQNDEVFGRPVDMLELPDGSVLISDDHADKIYRLSYE